MKKFLLGLALMASVFTVTAQRAGEASFSASDNDFNHSGFVINTGVGVMAGDCETGLGYSVDLGYRWHIYNGFCWDIIKVGAQTDLLHFTDMLDVRFLSGFRYNSAPLFSDKGLYANFALGYQFMTEDTDLGGLAYEVGVGFNLTRTTSIGLVWEGSNAKVDGYWADYTFNWGMFGIRLGLNF